MFKIALCQIKSHIEKSDNLAAAEKYIREAAEGGAQVISLPEMWNCPYATKFFKEYAEPADGETVKFMSALAKELGVYLIGGTIPEVEDDKYYNTSFCFDKEGNIIGRHRKVHLFDIDVKKAITFRESDTFTAGEDLTVLDTEYGKIGVAICYDIRFPEWHMKMAKAGAKVIVLPAAFNVTTGAAHWDLLIRTRAIDNQVYFAANSPARDKKGIYVAYGNSCISDPWGKFVAHADENECILYGDIDLDTVDSIRQQLPLLKHRREGLY